jgi:isochorismate synthase
VAHARRLGHAVALAVSECAPNGAEPLAALRLPAAGPAPERRFYFEHPAGGFALAAGGRAGLGSPAQDARGSGNRFGAVRDAVEAALAEAHAWAPGDEPPLGAHAVGGFAFFDRLDARQWPGFAPADVDLPAWCLIRRGGTTHRLAQTAVAPHDDPAAVQARIEALLARLRQAAPAPFPDPAPGSAATQVQGLDTPDARAHWAGVVRSARDGIRQGRLRKVVLARPLDLVCTPAPDPLLLLARLRAAYPECYTFLADPGAGQVYLGATPERLARLEPGHVALGALAGTFPRGATPEADTALRRLLLESAKEREEHAMVVEAIRDALAGLGRIALPDEPEVQAHKNLWHLFTPITLVPERGVSLLGLVERLHPTPAVGGLPREAALDVIRRVESFDRGWYGAPLGWLNAQGEGEFVVTLRSGTVSSPVPGGAGPGGGAANGRVSTGGISTSSISTGTVRLFAGGGIVAESDPDREFEETRIKFQPLLNALGQE